MSPEMMTVLGVLGLIVCTCLAGVLLTLWVRKLERDFIQTTANQIKEIRSLNLRLRKVEQQANILSVRYLRREWGERSR
jgi:hypothetical protein